MPSWMPWILAGAFLGSLPGIGSVLYVVLANPYLTSPLSAVFLAVYILIPYLLWVYGMENLSRVFHRIAQYLPVPTRPTHSFSADIIDEAKQTIRQGYIARTLTGQPIKLTKDLLWRMRGVIKLIGKPKCGVCVRSLQAGSFIDPLWPESHDFNYHKNCKRKSQTRLELREWEERRAYQDVQKRRTQKPKASGKVPLGRA